MSKLIVALLVGASAWWVGDWIGGAATAVLAAALLILLPLPGPPVLPLAVGFQWMQVTVGLYYHAATGRSLIAMAAPEHRTMVLAGLGCVGALAIGLRLGHDLAARYRGATPIGRPILSFYPLLAVYAAAFAATGLLQQLAWQYPLFTQAILAGTFIRLGILYLLLRRLIVPRVQWSWLALLLGVEVTIGLSGYFASFREPLILAGIAFAEAFNPRRVQHWALGVAVAAVLAASALFWMGVRGDIRQDFAEIELFAESRALRLDRLQQRFVEWRRNLGDTHELMWDVDYLVDRLWVVYYPALAMARVPEVLPHTGGALLGSALSHVLMPRALFPDKPELPSDSELVRRYAGVWVAGSEEDTSIAFGYAAESYVDFGLPGMFVPILVWALALGVAYRACLTGIRHVEIAMPLVTVVFWLSVYLFERSFAKWMGLTGTLLIYLGGAAFLLDRWLLHQASSRRAAGIGMAGLPALDR